MFLAEKYRPLNTCSSIESICSSSEGADVRVQAEVYAYLVNTGKILDNEAEKNSSEQSTCHLQGTSQQVVPGGALNHQRRKRIILRAQNLQTGATLSLLSVIAPCGKQLAVFRN